MKTGGAVKGEEYKKVKYDWKVWNRNAHVNVPHADVPFITQEIARTSGTVPVSVATGVFEIKYVQCPKCDFSVRLDQSICANCGYVFEP